MTGPEPRPRPASTVALLRDGAGGPEVLLTHRPSTMAFGPGLHVFPGGAVDAGDHDPGVARRSALDADACAAAWSGDLEPGAALAHAVAAIRELYEETGVLLASSRDGELLATPLVEEAIAAGMSLEALVQQRDLVLRTDLLVPLSRWVTPPVDVTRRYDTRFFVADLPPGAVVRAHAGEVVAHEWLSASDALAAAAGGRIELWPPTSTTLRSLAPARGAADVRRWLTPHAAAADPELTMISDEVLRARLGAGGGIPGVAVDCWLIGRERVVVVDPGDPNDAAAEAILAWVAGRGARVAAVICTAAVPDHVGGAVGLAGRARVPLLAAAATARLIGEPAEVIGHGTWITAGDVALRAGEPEDDPDGTLVLEAPDLGVVLVGDLGTRGPSRGIPEAPDEGAAGRAAFLEGLPGRRLPAHD